MSRRSLAIYAERARVLSDPLLAVARNPLQRRGERRIVGDVAMKLDLQPADELLEIGSSIGNLAIPLSHLVEKTTVIDSADCLDRLEARAPGQVERIAGDFLELDLGDRRFDKILIYATLHYLANMDEVLRFTRKACDLLKHGGKLLIGDLPNVDAKQRFHITPWGQWFTGWWADRAKMQLAAEAALMLEDDQELVHLGDHEVIDVLRDMRERGFESYLLPQDPELPFGFVREDILAVRR